MDDNISRFKDKKSIIERCINSSYQIKNNLNNSVSLKRKIVKLKDYLKFNLVSLNKKFIPHNSPIHFLYKTYNPKDPSFLKDYSKQINKLLLITYRSNYKKQINIKNKSSYTTDCGWGCTIRSSQMIFARLLYKIFKYLFKGKFSSDIIVKSVIPFFLDNNISLKDITIKNSDCFNIAINNYILQLDKYLDEKIKENTKKRVNIESIDPPFSIHKICTIGEIFGRTCGEWYSDFEVPKIYEIINSTFNIIPNLSIIHFSSEIYMKEIIEKCFYIRKNDEEISLNEDNNDFFLNEKKEKCFFKKMGAIFVSVRLGVKSIPSEYYLSIKKLFNCKEFLGFIGGGKVNQASYFFGYCDNDLLYLDPHYNQNSIHDLNEKNLMTYINKNIYKLPIKSLQCGFTIGFLFRNLHEFTDLYIFLKYFSIDKLPCFHVLFGNEKNENNLSQEEIKQYINNEEEDF